MADAIILNTTQVRFSYKVGRSKRLLDGVIVKFNVDDDSYEILDDIGCVWTKTTSEFEIVHPVQSV